MNSDGSGKTNLTSSLTNSIYDPAWSPDGQKIAFLSYVNGNYEIYVMNADGSNVLRLTENNASDDSPAWSPDSKMIAFVSGRDGDSEIYVMDADGGHVKRLTSNEASDYSPVWLP